MKNTGMKTTPAKAIIIWVFLFIVFATPSLFAQDTTCGIVWEPPIQLSPDSLDNGPPEMTVQGDTVHLTWWNSIYFYPYVRSVDGGKSFQQLRDLAPDSLGIISLCFITSAGSRLHAFFTASNNHGTTYETYHVFSDDRGDTWQDLYKFQDTLHYHTSTARGDTFIFRSSKRMDFYLLTKSLNGGITWQTDTCNMLSGNSPQIALTKDYLHLVKGSGFDSAGIWSEFVIQYRRSTDLGKTWSDSIPLSTVNFSRAYEPHLAAYDNGDSSVLFTAWKDEKYGCLTWVGCSVLGRIDRNGGSSFLPEQRFDERPAGYMISNAIQGNTWAIAWKDDVPDEMEGIHVRVSLDNGFSWSPVQFVSIGIEPRIAIYDNKIHVAWQQLIHYPDSSYKFQVFYRRGVIIPVSVDDNIKIPSILKLEQNYPNPFNPKTVISFKIQTASFTSLKVYDLLGREVATLVDERKNPGNYRVEWKAENNPSSVYYYKLSTYDDMGMSNVEVKKMILLK
jgi:hypothetical protein